MMKEPSTVRSAPLGLDRFNSKRGSHFIINPCFNVLFLSLVSFYFGLLPAITFSKTGSINLRVLNFWWSNNRDKNNRKPS